MMPMSVLVRFPLFYWHFGCLGLGTPNSLFVLFEPHAFLFGCVSVVFPVFCSMPRVDPHVPPISMY